MPLAGYHHYDPTVAIEGFDDVAEPQKLGLADQSLIELLRSVQRVQPLGVFAPWGVQTGSVDWQTVSSPDYNLILYPLSDALIARAERDGFGHEVGHAAVLTRSPVVTERVHQALVGSAFELLTAEAVYRLDDPQPTPTLYYLYRLKRRDDFTDPDGGRAPVGGAAKRLGGMLVYPVQVNRSGKERPHPDIAVADAQVVQSATQPPITAVPTPRAGQPHAAPAVAPAAAGGGLPWWLYATVGGAAAWAGWRWLRGR